MALTVHNFVSAMYNLTSISLWEVDPIISIENFNYWPFSYLLFDIGATFEWSLKHCHCTLSALPPSPHPRTSSHRGSSTDGPLLSSLAVHLGSRSEGMEIGKGRAELEIEGYES